MLLSSTLPSTPPTYWATVTVAEAAPECCGATAVATARTGMKATPMPRPMRSMPGSTWTTLAPSTVSPVRSTSPRAAVTRPAAIRTRGAKRCCRRAESWVEPMTTAATMGRRATPVMAGV